MPALRYAKTPPDFTFDSGGGPSRLRTLIGRPVVINFWATWCKPCLEEMDAFAKVRETYGDAVPVITVSQDAAGVARAYLLSRHLEMVPVVEDPERKIHAAYSVEPIPATIVLKRDGTVARVIVGELNWAELHGLLESELVGGVAKICRLC